MLYYSWVHFAPYVYCMNNLIYTMITTEYFLYIYQCRALIVWRPKDHAGTMNTPCNKINKLILSI